jgi:hypothetical protein
VLFIYAIGAIGYVNIVSFQSSTSNLSQAGICGLVRSISHRRRRSGGHRWHVIGAHISNRHESIQQNLTSLAIDRIDRMDSRIWSSRVGYPPVHDWRFGIKSWHRESAAFVSASDFSLHLIDADLLL